MLRTTFSLGCVESALMGVMATEVGHYLGVPTLNPGLSTDSKHAGLQTGYEKALKATTVCAADPDIVTGWGLIDSHNTMYLPQSVVDDEIAAMTRRLCGPVEVSEATLAGAVDRPRRARRRLSRPEGDGAPHPCRRASATTDLQPPVLRQWLDEGRTENDVACETVERSLAAHAARGPLLPDDQIGDPRRPLPGRPRRRAPRAARVGPPSAARPFPIPHRQEAT